MPHSLTEWLTPKISLELTYLPVGRFWMGSSLESSLEPNEYPQHFVEIKPFYLSLNLITQLQYKTIIGENPSSRRSFTHPVETVSYDDALKFCQILSERFSRKYRLPTEAEWEYSCRASTSTLYSFGDTIDPDLCCYRVARPNEEIISTSRVGSYKPNNFGLYDMHGNVWEWCEDNWHDNYENAPLDGSAWTYEDDSKVIRGGSWQDSGSSCRSASRDYLFKTTRLNNVGFRVAADI